ncbi:MAG: Fis family transcriptional regulator [Acidobacteriota bacterium]|nr:Fis family transcriptional regulator [Acidobacteriota bacterium]
MKEPVLTRALKAHAESVTGRNRGLLGMWAAECVINVLDPLTAVIREERRNDIVYGWNDETTGLQLVFEFKKMSRSANDRKHYLGPKGLERFVTGIYSRHQPVAAMVSMLTDARIDVVPPLKDALATANSVARLRLQRSLSNAAFEEPSALFQQAEFDTVHHRHVSLAPSHGTIRIAHLFLSFGYPITKRKARTRRTHPKNDKL